MKGKKLLNLWQKAVLASCHVLNLVFSVCCPIRGIVSRPGEALGERPEAAEAVAEGGVQTGLPFFEGASFFCGFKGIQKGQPLLGRGGPQKKDTPKCLNQSASCVSNPAYVSRSAG